MLQRLSVKSQLFGMFVAVVLLLVVFAVVVWSAISATSTAADGMGQGKDVVADILPPPLYVIEAELTVLQLEGAKADQVPSLLDRLSALKKDYDERNAFWDKAPLDVAVRGSLLGEQKQSADAFWKLVLGDFATAVKQGDSGRVHQIAGDVHKLYATHRAAVDATVKVASAYADNTLNSLHDTSVHIRWLILALACGGGLLAAFGIGAVTREILRRLGGEPLAMQAAAGRIASGDLTVRLEGESAGDSLLSSIRLMQTNLRDAIARSRQAAEQVAEAARSLAANSQQVSKGSSQQSEAAASMAASVEQVTVSVATVAESAGTARGLAEETGRLSTTGKVLVQDAIAEINRLADSVSRSSDVIQTLGEQSNQISSIVNVIKDIADQTNLLALNAAIEAARAGEQGRGFAVVADEVRKLAERTTASTQEIAAMISAILQGTQNAVHEMEEGRQQVSQSVHKAAMTGDSMGQIETGTQKVLSAVEEISSALREQSTASTQIARDVEKIAQMTEENSAAVGEVSRSAERLQELAISLKTSVDQFRI